MKGLTYLPSWKDLEASYSRYSLLSERSPSLGEIALDTQWARFDPRLAEIWVAWMSQNWQSLSPLDLRSQLLILPWPAAAGVLFEFVQNSIPSKMRALFKRWKELVTSGIQLQSLQQYFIGTRSLAGSLMMKDAQETSKEYLKWGFLGREGLWNTKGPTTGKIQLSKEVREHRVREWFKNSPRMTAQEYWTLIDRCISKRQAERDLASFSFLKCHGNTKGRWFSS